MAFRCSDKIFGLFVAASLVVASLLSSCAYDTEHHNQAQRGSEEIRSQHGFWEKTTNDPTAYFTLWLVVFTGVLAVSTIGLWIVTWRGSASQARDMKDSIEVAAKSADAAMLSARAAIAVQLPFLRMEPDKFGSGTSRNNDNTTRHYFYVYSIKMSNSGTTRAIPIELSCGWTFGNELPLEPVYRWETGFKVDAVIDASSTDPIEFLLSDLLMDVPSDAYEQLTNRSSDFWFYARLSYLDFMGDRHEASFCWRRAEGFGIGRFILDDTAAYNHKT